VESQMSRTLKRLRERLSHLLPVLILALVCWKPVGTGNCFKKNTNKLQGIRFLERFTI
jgi:hypothetical protein